MTPPFRTNSPICRMKCVYSPKRTKSAPMPRITIARIAAALSILLLASCQQSAIKEAIASQLSQYPESRVTDIYKNFCIALDNNCQFCPFSSNPT